MSNIKNEEMIELLEKLDIEEEELRITISFLTVRPASGPSKDKISGREIYLIGRIRRGCP